MNKDNERIIEEFREKKQLAKDKLKALGVINGTVVDAEVITEDWLTQTLDKVRGELLEAEIERLEGYKEYCNPKSCAKVGNDECDICLKNEVIDTVLSHLQESKIKE